jgi:predicted small lipoprotein YifL
MIYWMTFLGIILMLSACGKKGPVEPLEPDQYPRPYPKPLPSKRG